MNNGNRYKLKKIIGEIDLIILENRFEKLNDLLEMIELIKEDEECSYDNLKGGLIDGDIGSDIKSNIDKLEELMPYIDEIIENLDRVNNAVDCIREAL